jgi:hypothetical protein
MLDIFVRAVLSGKVCGVNIVGSVSAALQDTISTYPVIKALI